MVAFCESMMYVAFYKSSKKKYFEMFASIDSIVRGEKEFKLSSIVKLFECLLSDRMTCNNCMKRENEIFEVARYEKKKKEEMGKFYLCSIFVP
jgi:uncharacterized UBP type Zn finger protein